MKLPRVVSTLTLTLEESVCCMSVVCWFLIESEPSAFFSLLPLAEPHEANIMMNAAKARIFLVIIIIVCFSVR